MTTRQFGFAAALLATAACASADFVTPAWNRPIDNAAASAIKSTYQFFDIFLDEDFETPGTQELSPDIGVNPNGTAYVTETAGGFTTGLGNLYSPFVNLDMKVHIPGYAPTAAASTRFLVQIETLGDELVYDYDTQANNFSLFKINATPIESLRGFKYRELSRVAGMGSTVQHAFEFIVPTTASSYELAYQTRYTSTSQAGISVDTFVAIPGDFDYDGDRDVDDLDLLLRATPGASPGDIFDVTLDDIVNNARNSAGSDLDAWVRVLAETTYGDTNLDQRVDFDDLLTLAQNYGQAVASWAFGDFDASGTVDFDDLLTLAQNYGFGTSSLTAADFQSDWALAQSLVPEPTSLGSLALLGLIARRRRR